MRKPLGKSRADYGKLLGVTEAKHMSRSIEPMIKKLKSAK